MRLFSSFPLLLLPIALYNLVAFSTATTTEAAQRCVEVTGRAVHPLTCTLATPFTTIRMAGTMATATGSVEHVQWAITGGDVMIVLSLFLLFAEVLKATGGRSGTVVNHALSLVVFIVGLVEFLLLPGFATSVFFLILLMSLLDVLGGFIVTIASSRRDVAVVN